MHILADIGGTKTRMAGTSDMMGFTEPVIYDTPKEYAIAIDTFVKNARQIAGEHHIGAVQIGIRGAILRERGAIYDTVLSDWSEKTLTHDLRIALSIPKVNIENDVATVAMGEAHFGAGRNAGTVVYITISTGVNGWRVINGVLDRGVQGFEVGGQYLNIEPTITFEEMVSGSAVQKQYNKHPKELGRDNPLWDELAQLAAYGVHNTILHWSPDRVVMGGSMLNEIGIPVPKVAENVNRIMKKFPVVPDIVHSELGDLGGLWGALAILRQTI